jgi:hypothetical protein
MYINAACASCVMMIMMTCSPQSIIPLHSTVYHAKLHYEEKQLEAGAQTSLNDRWLAQLVARSTVTVLPTAWAYQHWRPIEVEEVLSGIHRVVIP